MDTYILYRLVARGLERITTADLLHGEQMLSRLVVMFQDIPLRLGRAKQERDYDELLQDLREAAQHQHLNTWLERAIANQHKYISNVKKGEFEGAAPQEKPSHIFIAVCAAQPHRMTNTRTLLHRILHVLLVEIRVRAYETGRDELFKLSDLFHNIPLHLEKITQGDSTSLETLDWLRQRAASSEITPWLEQELQDLQSNTT